MQLTTFLSAAATVATVSALGAVQLNKDCNLSKPYARVINRCDYPVNVWSVVRGSIGCPQGNMVTLKKGEAYNENYQTPKIPGEGVSIKISKTEDCTNHNLVQLEYFLETRPEYKDFQYNFLDVSYVDCTGNDCPTKKEGYYLKAGGSTARAAKASADGSWCPVLSCSDAASCAKMSYILPDDSQTKTCDHDSSMDFYMCGSHAPSDDDDKPADKPASSVPAPASSSKKVETPTPKPSTTLKAVVSSAANYKVNIAAVTNAPKVEDNKAPKVKTKVVYVTAYEYANAKRNEHAHAHAHARRHQPFNA